MTPAAGWRYGLMGLPLAFVALPLYVQLPNYYAREFGVPLAALGGVLLATRLFDALLDPWIGGFADRLFARSARAVLAAAVMAALVLAAGFLALVAPPVRGVHGLLQWVAVMLVVTYAAYSLLTVMHQAWGAMLGGDEATRARIVGWREGFGLAGVLVASALPLLIGLPALAAVLAGALAAACWAWWLTQRPQPAPLATARGHWADPLRQPAFRRLLAVFLLNGIASAIPATLVLFFVQDRLALAPAWEPALLGAYFACAAVSIPLWLRCVARWGLSRCWLAGMGLAVSVFAFAAALREGDAMAFLAVCALSGFALGADLAVPGALLAGIVSASGARGSAEGRFFGWWNFASKLNLAVAAGLALPVLAWAGYAPGVRDPQALQALTAAYCILPCALKAGAALLLSRFDRHMEAT